MPLDTGAIQFHESKQKGSYKNNSFVILTHIPPNSTRTLSVQPALYNLIMPMTTCPHVSWILILPTPRRWKIESTLSGVSEPIGTKLTL